MLIVVLLISMDRLRKGDYAVLANRMAKRERANLHLMRPCPLCGTLLQRGERVHSVVYPAGERNAGMPVESLVHMYGCPHCRPPQGTQPRICPVCKETVPTDGYVIGRMFENEKRKHVRVLGCTRCRGAKAGVV